MSEPADLTDTDRAYMAALVDEKGLIYVEKSKTQLKLRLDLNGLSESTAKWIASKFKGSKRCRTRTYFVTERAAATLAMIYSHLTSPTKKAQAQLVFKFNGQKPASGRIWSTVERAMRWERAAEINHPEAKPQQQVGLSASRLQIVRMAGG